MNSCSIRPACRKPLLRQNGSFREGSWDEALDYAAGELRRIRDRHGPDSIGFLTSARCTNEENYLLQKLARTAIGTNKVGSLRPSLTRPQWQVLPWPSAAER